MAAPRVLILRAPGTNCDEETAHAFSLAGGVPDRWHINRLLEEPTRVAEFQIFCIAGGFSFGDDLSAGRILGSQLVHHLAGVLDEFYAAGKLILGICNGFQVLLKTNLLCGDERRGPTCTLALNESGKFEARWVRLRVDGNKSVFLSNIRELELPVAHAEGKFVVRDSQSFDRIDAAGRFVLRYLPAAGKVMPRDSAGCTPYPHNPNGAIGDVAGMCDATGRVLGLMPHPERFVDATQHPRWTRGPARDAGEGLAVFQNAVQYFR